jgi:hypothetical protein
MSPDTEGLYTQLNTQEFKNSNENYKLEDKTHDRPMLGSHPFKVVPMTPKEKIDRDTLVI